MPKQVKLKNGEVVISYTLEESKSKTRAHIYKQAEVLRHDLKASKIKQIQYV